MHGQGNRFGKLKAITRVKSNRSRVIAAECKKTLTPHKRSDSLCKLTRQLLNNGSITRFCGRQNDLCIFMNTGAN